MKRKIIVIVSKLLKLVRIFLHFVGFFAINFCFYLFLWPNFNNYYKEGVTYNYDELWVIYGEQALFNWLWHPRFDDPIINIFGYSINMDLILEDLIHKIVLLVSYWGILCYEILLKIFGPSFENNPKICLKIFLFILLFIYILSVYIMIYDLKLNPKENIFQIKLWITIMGLLYIFFFSIFGYLFIFTFIENFKLRIVYVLFSILFTIFNNSYLIKD